MDLLFETRQKKEIRNDAHKSLEVNGSEAETI